jgi:hypothetical protein
MRRKIYIYIILLSVILSGSCALFYPQFFVEDAIDKRGDSNWGTPAHVNQYWEAVGQRGFSAGTASYIKIDFDTVSGLPYVAYRDSSNNNAVSVMKYNGTNWVYVGNPGFSVGDSRYVDLFVDGAVPYVAFQDMTNGGKLSVMTYSGGTWQYVGGAGVTVREVRDISLYVSGGIPYVAFADKDTLYSLNVKQYSGGVWNDLSTNKITANSVAGVSLWVEGGVPYALFQDTDYFSSATLFRYLGSPAAGWTSVGFRGFSDGAVSGTVLAFDAAVPYAAFQDIANGSRATVMKYTLGVWSTVGAKGFTPNVAAFIDFSINSGTPYIVFEDWDSTLYATVMKYLPSGVVHTNSGTGAITTNDGWVAVGGKGFSGGVATYLSMDFYNNIPYVAFLDGSTAGSNKVTVMRLK